MNKSTPYDQDSGVKSKVSPLGALARPWPDPDEEALSGDEGAIEFAVENGDESAPTDAAADADSDADGDVDGDVDAETASTAGESAAPPPSRWHRAIALSGAILVFAGFGAGIAWSSASALRDALAPLGVTPAMLVTVGALLAGLGTLQRRIASQEQDLRALFTAAELATAQHDHTHAQLAYLVEADTTRLQQSTQSTSDTQQALHLLERQDEKINNLSKATKMYGKPLLDITSQIGESSQRITEVGNSLQALKGSLEQSGNRLEAALRAEMRRAENAAAPNVAIDSAAIEAAANAARASAREIGALREELNRAMAEASSKVHLEIAQLDRHLEQTRTTILGSLQARPVTDDHHADALKHIQREIAALTSSLAAIRAPVSSVPPSVPAAPGAPEPTSPPELGATAGTPVSGEAPAKSVLGAIAKLKQMRK